MVIFSKFKCISSKAVLNSHQLTLCLIFPYARVSIVDFSKPKLEKLDVQCWCRPFALIVLQIIGNNKWKPTFWNLTCSCFFCMLRQFRNQILQLSRWMDGKLDKALLFFLFSFSVLATAPRKSARLRQYRNKIPLLMKKNSGHEVGWSG